MTTLAITAAAFIIVYGLWLIAEALHDLADAIRRADQSDSPTRSVWYDR